MKLKILGIMLLLFPFVVNAQTINVTNESELINAISNNDSVSLINNIELTQLITINGDITITGNGNSLIYNKDYYDSIFKINTDASLVIDNTIIDGANDWEWINEDEDKLNYEKTNISTILNIPRDTLTNHSFIINGNLTLNNSTIQNFFNTSDGNLVFLANEGSNVVLNKTKIQGCYGAIFKLTKSTLELNDGNIISDNYGYGNKGGIFQLDTSNATMGNTEIINNVSVARSGAIFGIVNKSLLTMNDGKIDNNYSKYHGSASTGSMITLETGSGFIMNGGSISNNVGTLASVISSRWTNTADSGDLGIIFNKGTIKGNTTYKDSWLNASIFIRSSATIGKDMVIDGDVVVNNTSATLLNNGTINGILSVNDSTGTATNNGKIYGTASLINGKLINNGYIENAKETNLVIENNGTIEKEYIKTLPTLEGKYIVTFDMMGGKETNRGYTKMDAYVDVDTPISKDIITDVIKYGHTFSGEWHTSSDLNSLYDFSKNVDENIVLYAYNIPNEHKVIWKNDGEEIIKMYRYGEEIILPPTPIKDGFVFVKWDNFVEGITLPDNDLTFTAVWEEVENPDTSSQLFFLLSTFVFLIAVLFSLIFFKIYINKLN